jgi:DNA invertase Pin-like site-specific DNA recombinase
MRQLRERNDAIKDLAKQGLSYAHIGRVFDISRQRVWDIIHKARLSTDSTIDTIKVQE